MGQREFMNGSYLGDGVYAGFDGYHVVLRLRSHLDDDGEICLEDKVALALMDYIQQTFKFKKYAKDVKSDEE